MVRIFSSFPKKDVKLFGFDKKIRRRFLNYLLLFQRTPPPPGSILIRFAYRFRLHPCRALFLSANTSKLNSLNLFFSISFSVIQHTLYTFDLNFICYTTSFTTCDLHTDLFNNFLLLFFTCAQSTTFRQIL